MLTEDGILDKSEAQDVPLNEFNQYIIYNADIWHIFSLKLPHLLEISELNIFT